MLPPWTSADYDELVALSRAQSPPIDPAQAALVLWEEGGMNPRSDPFGGQGASGMNGMDVPNLTSLGLTKAQWLAMSVSQQLQWIFRVWHSWGQTFNGGRFPGDAGELLALNFLPGQFKNIGAGSNPNAVLAGKNGPLASDYAKNGPLQNASGTITVNTLRTYMQGVAVRAGATWTGIMGQIQAAIARAGSPAPSTPVASTGGGAGTGGSVVLLLLAIGGAVWLATRSA